MTTPRDEKRLEGVDARLVAVVRAAFTLWAEDPRNASIALIVTEGVRTRERQMALYGTGRTALECAAAGVPVGLARPNLAKLTWTLKSKHIDGKAVDCAPMRAGLVLWNDSAAFDRMADCFSRAAAALNVSIRNGADWDRDGIRREKGETDSPHFELT